MSSRRAERLDVAASDFAWLGTKHWPGGAHPAHGAISTDVSAIPIDLPDLARLAQLDALHCDLPILRLGWIYLVAQVRRDGKPRRVVLPLVERPVRLEAAILGAVRGARRATGWCPWAPGT